MANLGTFDPQAVLLGWFDETADSRGWAIIDLLSAGGGTPQDLAGDAAGQATSSADLEHSVPLGGAAAALAPAAGGLSVSVPLEAAAAAAALAAAQLAIDKAMASAAAAGASAGAGVSLLKGLLAVAAAQAAATGNLGLSKLLDSTAAGYGTATGELSVVGAVGTLTTPALKANDGTVWANQTGATAHVYALSGAHVVTKSGQATDALGVMAIADSAIAAGTPYRVVLRLASGATGMETLTAA